MFRVRRLYDDALPANRQAILEVQEILRKQFAAVRASEIDSLPDLLRNPFTHQFRAILYVGEDAHARVKGFAEVLHDPDIGFCFLNYLASAPKLSGRGIGAALYEQVRDHAARLKAKGLFFECLPDDPDRCADPALRKNNAARLRFYERYRARPILGTAYETPVPGGSSDCMPHLMYDGLDQPQPPRAAFVRRVVRAILERRYAHLCPPDYINRVVASVKDDPVRLRPPRYFKTEVAHRPATPRASEPIALLINDQHEIHHIRERGYVESPVRIRVIRQELDASGLFQTLPVRSFPLEHITAVHSPDFVDYLHRACAEVPPGKSVYPYVFPVRNAARPPKYLSIRAGYFCIDTFTPINQAVIPAARRAVDCALTAATEILAGRRLAYALVRPPGHHAESRWFGGFCYFNNAAIAAQYLVPHGRVAILDVDYHHGNGQQEIFYNRDDVLTVSLHGDPDFAYPYFSGFADETGEGAGRGHNINVPLPEFQDGPQFRQALARALEAVTAFRPAFLVLALGLDTSKGDPTGSWTLTARDFVENGRMIGRLQIPTTIVQEGGYRTRTLGVNARSFFTGLAETALA